MARYNSSSILLLALCIVAVGFKVALAFPSADQEELEIAKRTPVAELTAGTSPACKSQGGLCMAKSECPAGKLSEKSGLCTSAGMECCHGLPSSITVCEHRGGVCMTTAACGGAPKDPAGKCSSGQVCCNLIR